MTPRIARIIAWLFVVIYFILSANGLYLQGLTNTTPANIAIPLLPYFVTMIVIGIWPVVGARIISHHPRHPVGWLLFTTFPLIAFVMFAIGYASYAVSRAPDWLPIPGFILFWLKDTGYPCAVVALTLMYLLFPTGKLLAPRWRVFAWMSICALPVIIGSLTVKPGPLSLFPGLDNPDSVSEPVWNILFPIYLIMVFILALCNLAAIVSLFFRVRKAQGDEAQQVKWLIMPATVYWIGILIFFLSDVFPSVFLVSLSSVLHLISVPAIVIAVAFAIFRYRLYDVDLILNRTLVYGTLTACVVGLYVVIVGGAGLVIQNNSHIAGLLITGILTGVIIRPMRVFLQQGVDRLIPAIASVSPALAGGAIPVQTESTFPPETEDVLQAPRWMRVARAVWYPVAVLAMIIFLAATPGLFMLAKIGVADHRFSANPSPWISFIVRSTLLVAVIANLGYLLLAFVLFRRRPDDRVALFTSFLLLVYGMILGGQFEALDLFIPGIASFNTSFLIPLLQAFLLLLFAVFPDGRFVPSWTRKAIPGAFLLIPFLLIWTSRLLQSSPDPAQPMIQIILGVNIIFFVAISLSSIYVQVYRYRYVSTRLQKQQTKWILYGIGLWVTLQLLSGTSWIYAYTLPQNTPYPAFLAVGLPLWVIAIVSIPLTLTIAIMRYRLFEIDIIINRSLLYGGLTAAVGCLYVLVVGGIGLAFHSNSNLAGVILTTALIVVVYRPLRAQLQRGVDRLMPIEQIYTDMETSSMRGASTQFFDQQQDTFREQVQNVQLEGNIPRLPVWIRMLLRTMWFFWAAIAWGIFILAFPSQINTATMALQGDLTGPVPPWMIVILHSSSILAQAATSLISLVLAGVLYLKRPREGMALFLSYFLLASGVVSVPLSFLEPYWPGIHAIMYSVIQPIIYGPLLVAFLAVFPNGRFVPAWMRWPVFGAILYAPVGAFVLTTQAASKSAPISIIAVLIWFVLIFTGLYAQIARYRRVSNVIERQQTKWVIYGFSVAAFIASLLTILTINLNRSLPNSPLPWWSPLANFGWNLAYAALPISVTFAVMRYRLFDIDFLINRTLVYTLLTGGVVSLYALVVGGISVLFQTQSNLLIALLATGLVAVLFQPLRDRLQRGVNRLIYGERDDPIEALSRLGRSLETALPPDQVLPALVQTIAQTLKLPFVAIALKGQQVAAFGHLIENPITFPLTFQGETTGELLVAPHSPDEAFTSSEMQLLRNLARQAGAAVRNAQLTADLQRSRQNLVTTREEERHRLRRDLHDGIGPTMAGLTLKLDAAKDLIAASLETGDTIQLEEAIQLLSQLKSQTQETVQDVRRIVHDLRPPSLDVLGLAAALRAHFGQVAAPANLSIQLTTIPKGFPRLSAAVEVAAYRIVLEAVTNVIHHAKASVCQVSLVLENGYLQVKISDNGVGIPRQHNFGVGLNSMRERAEELGGCFELNSSQKGTSICAQIPVPQEK